MCCASFVCTWYWEYGPKQEGKALPKMLSGFDRQGRNREPKPPFKKVTTEEKRDKTGLIGCPGGK